MLIALCMCIFPFETNAWHDWGFSEGRLIFCIRFQALMTSRRKGNETETCWRIQIICWVGSTSGWWSPCSDRGRGEMRGETSFRMWIVVVIVVVLFILVRPTEFGDGWVWGKRRSWAKQKFLAWGTGDWKAYHQSWWQKEQVEVRQGSEYNGLR